MKTKWVYHGFVIRKPVMTSKQWEVFNPLMNKQYGSARYKVKVTYEVMEKIRKHE